MEKCMKEIKIVVIIFAITCPRWCIHEHRSESESEMCSSSSSVDFRCITATNCTGVWTRGEGLNPTQ